jgi:RND family efflux transporter MFP subunit
MKHTGMKKKWVILGAGAAVGLSCGAYFLHPRPAHAQFPVENAGIRVVDAERGTISQIIPARGSVSSNCEKVVNCVASGEVIKLPFLVGDSVKKGDLVCQLDPNVEQNAVDQAKMALSRAIHRLQETRESAKHAEDDLQISIQQAEESIASLRVKATNMDNKSDRQKQLLSQSLASQEEFETAETDAAAADMELRNAILAKQQLNNRSAMLQTEKGMNVEAAEDIVNSDQIALKNAENRLSSTTIMSPMDGVVSDLKTALNGWIEPSGEYGRAAVMTISDLSRIFVNASIDERRIGDVRAGQKVEISADSYPSRRFSGVVSRVAPTGVSDGDIVAFGVKIEVTSRDKSFLKPPMSASVKIVQQTKDGALLVPTQAIKQKERNSYITIVNADGQWHDRPVKLGLTDGINDEVLEGLSDGDRVLVSDAPLTVAQASDE